MDDSTIPSRASPSAVAWCSKGPDPHAPVAIDGGLDRVQNWNTGRRAETWGPAKPGTCYSRMLSIAGIWGVVAYQYGPGTTYSDWVYGY